MYYAKDLLIALTIWKETSASKGFAGILAHLQEIVGKNGNSATICVRIVSASKSEDEINQENYFCRLDKFLQINYHDDE